MRKLFLFCTAGVIAFSTVNGQRVGELGGTQLVPAGEINAIDKTIKDFSQYSYNSFLNGSVLSSFNNKENVKGRKYFFDSWVKGVAVTDKGQVIDNNKFFFNVDKVNNLLLTTEDKKTIIEVDKNLIRSFTLQNASQTVSFERVDLINPKIYLQVLTRKDSGYTLYKATFTKFVRADYSTNGLTESGNPYDEYVDTDIYYLLLPGGKEYKTIGLRARSIRQAFRGQEKIVNDYLYQHAGENMDDAFLIKLVDEVNQ